MTTYFFLRGDLLVLCSELSRSLTGVTKSRFLVAECVIFIGVACTVVGDPTNKQHLWLKCNDQQRGEYIAHLSS